MELGNGLFSGIKKGAKISFHRHFNNWFMLYGAHGKFGEHERSVTVARGDSRGQL